MDRLGKNVNRYCGEGIDIAAVTRATRELALSHGWAEELLLDLPGLTLRAYKRPSATARKSIYIGTGVHGDEPAGPLALMELLRENFWPEDVSFWLSPCINPTGFPLNQRENAEGIDLNRDYRHLRSAEVSAHVAWLEKQPRFDLCLLLHEDWEANGFYLYELNPRGETSQAEAVLQNVSTICPIEHATLVDNWEAKAGIIRPSVAPAERPQWAEALYLISHKTDHTYTLEAPSDFPLAVRVKAHTTAVRALLATA